MNKGLIDYLFIDCRSSINGFWLPIIFKFHWSLHSIIKTVTVHYF